jgi:OOP family OmpA-OmpF porin
MPQKVFVALGFAAATLAGTGIARAQVLPSIDARTWRPSTDPNASLVVEPAVTPGPGAFSFGGYASYALRPLTLRHAGTEDVAYRPVEHQLGLDAVANLGLGQRFALGAVVPVLLYQEGDTALPATVSSTDKVPAAGIGDVGLSMKGAIIPNAGGGFGLAGLGYVTFPTGDRASFMSDGSATVSARVLAEYSLVIASAQASVGYKVRTDRSTWPAAEVGGYRFGDEIPWTLGLSFRPGILGLDSGNRQRWEIAAHGWVPAGPVGPFGSGDPGSAALSPVLLGASDRIEIGHYRDTFVLAGAEVGLNRAVGVPVVRGVLSIGWSPREHDMDHDGIKDDIDGCPEIPEDKDGFEDADGCPEIDNDDDGILDKEDACPNVAGVESADPKKNGCPLADKDGDGIGDDVDACPTEKGVASTDPKQNGCPVRDTDQDGLDDAHDKCPTQPEDKDGFQDADGCPDPDNDGDGISDHDDACPNEKGEPSSDPARNGCPSPDRDGDTYDNAVDKCPDAAEVFNGVDDEDGCPDEGGKPLVTIDDKRGIRLAKPLKITGKGEAFDVDPSSMMTLRALALELNRHRDWTLAIGARPAGGDPTKAQLDSLAKSFAVVRALSGLSRRDGVAETVSWDAVKKQPQSETGVAFLVLVTPQAASAPQATSAPAASTPQATPEKKP